MQCKKVFFSPPKYYKINLQQRYINCSENHVVLTKFMRIMRSDQNFADDRHTLVIFSLIVYCCTECRNKV
jgi:hypothetical protein